MSLVVSRVAHPRVEPVVEVTVSGESLSKHLPPTVVCFEAIARAFRKAYYLAALEKFNGNHALAAAACYETEVSFTRWLDAHAYV